MIITAKPDPSYETITAIHEFGHMFGITDHYSAAHPDKEGANTYCIYGNRKNEIKTVSSGIICPGCEAQLMANINIYTPVG